MFGIYFGIMTPTEAAACSAVLALLFALAYRKMDWALLQKSLFQAIRTTCMVLLIVIGANILSSSLGMLAIPAKMATWVTSLALPPIGVLIAIYVMYIFLGCFFEGLSMMVLTLQIVTPILVALGYDLLWFGVALVMLIEIAGLTPPVGLNLYAIQGLDPKRPLSVVIKGSMPFVIVQITSLAIVTIYPQIVTWFPNTMWMR